MTRVQVYDVSFTMLPQFSKKKSYHSSWIVLPIYAVVMVVWLTSHIIFEIFEYSDSSLPDKWLNFKEKRQNYRGN